MVYSSAPPEPAEATVGNAEELPASTPRNHSNTASSSGRTANETAADAVGASSSETDEGEVWEDARDGTEHPSDEGEVFLPIFISENS